MARRLDADEKALWGRVIATVQPLHRVKPPAAEVQSPPPSNEINPAKLPPRRAQAAPPPRVASPKPSGISPAHNLDGHWDRRINKGAIIPDISVDLHGTGLSGAYSRLDGALEQAIAQNMRVILLVTGKTRSHDRHSGQGRGAIASVVRDWLAASRHSSRISAVRAAHPRHGGAGALYIILKR